MSITQMAVDTWTVYRLSNVLFEAQDASAGIVTAAAPPSAAQVGLAFTSPITGTVTIEGTVGGVASTDVVTFTAAQYAQSLLAFTSITKITASVPTNLTAKCVGVGGEPVPMETTVAAGVWGRFDATTTAFVVTEAGAMRRIAGGPHLLIDEDQGYVPKEGDIIVNDADGKKYRGGGDIAEKGAAFVHHYEIPLAIDDNA